MKKALVAGLLVLFPLIAMATCWSMRDNALYCSGKKVAEVRKDDIYNARNQRVGTIRGEGIFDAHNRRVASVRNEVIYDSHNHRLGSMDEARHDIKDSVGGMTVAALWVFFVH